MPDDLIEKTTEVPPESPPPEPVDEEGVPYKNRVAEWKRKAEEAEARAQEKDSLVEQYKQVLGEQRSKPPVPQQQPQQDFEQLLSEYGTKEQQLLRAFEQRIVERSRAIAQETGYGLMTDVSHTTVLQQDAELLEETKRQMALLNNNPLWVNADDRLKRDRAIEGAKAVLNAKRAAKPPAPQTPPPDGLPATRRGAPQPTPDDKKAFIDEWKAQPENIKMFNMFYRGTDINSPEGKKLYDTVAEEAWNGTKFTGAVAMAAQGLQSPVGEEMLGKDFGKGAR